MRRIQRMRRERHTRRLATAGLITAVTTGAVLAAVTGQVSEAKADRATESFDLTQVSWPADTVVEETAVQRDTAQSALDLGVDAEADKQALDEAQAEAQAEAERVAAEEAAAAEAQAEAEAAKPDWVSPSDDHISSTFGQRWGRLHAGVDFANELGEPIVAVGDGTVTYAGWMAGYGNLVVIDHGNGVETAYGHGSEILVDVGEDTDPGEEVLLTGNTGNSTGPHLHFEVRIDGEQVDPLPWLEEQGVVPAENDED